MAVARGTAAQQHRRMNLSPSRSWGTCCTSGGSAHRCVHGHWQQAWCPSVGVLCRAPYPSAAVIARLSSSIAHATGPCLHVCRVRQSSTSSPCGR